MTHTRQKELYGCVLACGNSFAGPPTMIHQDAPHTLVKSVPALTPVQIAYSESTAIRSIITGTKTHLTGAYSSRKAGCPQPWESSTELRLIQCMEADPEVEYYLAQPAVLTFRDPRGAAVRYIPDAAVDFANGETSLIEAKQNFDDLRDLDYLAKLVAAAKVCASFGWTFRIIVSAHLNASPAHVAALEAIQSRRHTEITLMDILSSVRRIALRGGEVSFGELAEMLGGDPVGTAKVHAMIAKRIFSVDLTAGVDASTPLARMPQIHTRAQSFRVLSAMRENAA